MPQRHVIKRVVHRHIHVIDTAKLDFIIRAIRRNTVCRYQLMRQHDIAHIRINLTRAQHRTQGSRVIVPYFHIGKIPTHIAWLQKRQQPKCHVAPFVFQNNALDLTRIHRRETHALAFQQTLRICDTLRRIMVAGNSKHAKARRHRIGQKRVEHRNSFSAWRRLVVNITSNQKRLNLPLFGNTQDLPQNMPLIIQQRDAIQPLANMQVGHMQQPHGNPYPSRSLRTR